MKLTAELLADAFIKWNARPGQPGVVEAGLEGWRAAITQIAKILLQHQNLLDADLPGPAVAALLIELVPVMGKLIHDELQRRRLAEESRGKA